MGFRGSIAMLGVTEAIDFCSSLVTVLHLGVWLFNKRNVFLHCAVEPACILVWWTATLPTAMSKFLKRVLSFFFSRESGQWVYDTQQICLAIRRVKKTLSEPGILCNTLLYVGHLIHIDLADQHRVIYEVVL